MSFNGNFLVEPGPTISWIFGGGGIAAYALAMALAAEPTHRELGKPDRLKLASATAVVGAVVGFLAFGSSGFPSMLRPLGDLTVFWFSLIFFLFSPYVFVIAPVGFIAAFVPIKIYGWAASSPARNSIFRVVSFVGMSAVFMWATVALRLLSE